MHGAWARRSRADVIVAACPHAWSSSSRAPEPTCRPCSTCPRMRRTGHRWWPSARTATGSRGWPAPSAPGVPRSSTGSRNSRPAFDPDLVVSAGFMKIVGRSFLGRFGGRFINTHPALLPSFPGMHGVPEALEYGVKVTGCTVFLVDGGTDTGPVIAQVAVPVHDDDDTAVLTERVKVAERSLLVETAGRMARAGWSIQGRKVRLGR